MKIKQIPEDFVVNEVIDLKTSKEGDQLYFLLTKKNWTTESAIRVIAKKSGFSYRRFKFAGTKDKIAITKQLVSAFKIPEEKLEKIKLKDIKIEIIGKGENPISIGSLKGNKFNIILRDLAKLDIKNIKNNLDKIKKKGMPNFFGKQRFGKGNTHLIGKAILKGNLEEAVKLIICFKGDREHEEKIKFREFAENNWGEWGNILERIPRSLNLERNVLIYLTKNKNDFAGSLRVLPKHIRKLYIHAYQSWLWNKALEKSLIKKEFPLPGFKIKLGNNEFSKTIKELLAKDKLSLEDFKCKRMPELAVEGELRKSFIKPKSIKLGKEQKDELNKNKSKIEIKFELPKGCYATVLCDLLFKN